MTGITATAVPAFTDAQRAEIQRIIVSALARLIDGFDIRATLDGMAIDLIHAMQHQTHVRSDRP